MINRLLEVLIASYFLVSTSYLVILHITSINTLMLNEKEKMNILLTLQTSELILENAGEDLFGRKIGHTATCERIMEYCGDVSYIRCDSYSCGSPNGVIIKRKTVEGVVEVSR